MDAQQTPSPIDLPRVLGRSPWRTAAATFVGLCAAVFLVAHNHPLAGDEHIALFQARAFAAGHLRGKFPRDLVSHLIPLTYQQRWLIVGGDGSVASIYWPGYALILAPFTLIGAPWACNPLLASLSLVLLSKTASKLTSDPRAGGWAILFALASPGFVGLAISYFSMTAHLFFNLLFAWLLLERTRSRLVAAGAVGSIALVLSNPVPHLLFALPWILWIGRQPGGRRQLIALGAGYAPLALTLGLGWWLFLRQLQGDTGALPYLPDGDLLHQLENLIWYLLLEFRKVFAIPGSDTLNKRIGEQVRLWSWESLDSRCLRSRAGGSSAGALPSCTCSRSRSSPRCSDIYSSASIRATAGARVTSIPHGAHCRSWPRPPWCAPSKASWGVTSKTMSRASRCTASCSPPRCACSRSVSS